MLGIIGGSSFLKSKYFADFETFQVSTPHGIVKLRKNVDCTVVYVQRHTTSPTDTYAPPHCINYKGIMHALKSLGCKKVLGFGSVGSLKESIPLGTLVVPHDYLNFWKPIAVYDDARAHIVPKFDEDMRKAVLAALKEGGFAALDQGVYTQTVGPRFETQAEIRMLAAFGEIVGMTCGYEATLAATLGLPYCVTCMVDNMANGVAQKTLSGLEEFKDLVHQNEATMEKVLGTLLAAFAPGFQPSAGTKKRQASSEADNQAVRKKIASLQIADNGAKIKVDLCVSARYIVPVQPENTVLENHSLVVDQGQIVDILPTAIALSKYVACEHVDHSQHHVLFPGLINLHAHTGMTLLRGYADDVDLMDWLGNHIWPCETKFVSPEFVAVSSELAIAEMVRCGTTCFSDMYFYPEATAEVVDRTGMRSTLGMVFLDFPSSYAASPQEYIDNGLKLFEAYKEHPLISTTFSPHAPYTVCDENLEKLRDLSIKHGVPFNIHLHETKNEVDHSAAGDKGSFSCHRSEQKCRPFANFERMGIINDKLIAVHMTQMTDEEIQTAGAKKVSIAHCPSSNLKLSSGFCPVGKLVESGANVCIGTDSCASNNTLDMMAEMRLAAILAKPVRGDPKSVTAAQALTMATLNGAKALGIDAITGSLEVGKAADFIALDLNHLELMPLYNVISHLVYAANSHRITDVWVQGRRLLRNGHLTTINEKDLMNRVGGWTKKITTFRDEAAAARATQQANATPQ